MHNKKHQTISITFNGYSEIMYFIDNETEEYIYFRDMSNQELRYDKSKQILEIKRSLKRDWEWYCASLDIIQIEIV